MPKRTDLKSIAIIGAGPIVIGQACEFDYSGAQACKALKEEGYRVILINSNPATIMTDPGLADRTYIEPITPESVARVLRKERPDALLPTMGGQTGLNTAFQVADAGVLKELGIELIGADRDVIHRAEDREAFRAACREAGCDVPKSGLAHNMDDARRIIEHVGLPCIVRPAFTLGGMGGGMAYNFEEFERVAAAGLRASIVSEILIEESVERWKELEVELMADGAGNRLVVCLIENIDPMGVHTGDSIAVAPLQTCTDREIQRLRSEAMRIMEAVGLRTCGCNVQFAQNPRDGRLVAIELNPRVSRSSALASKATGYPIARIAAKVAVGYLLPEITNPLLGSGSACFEPAVDYCVVKFPRFAFEKFPGANEDVTIQMKSVGEVMAIGGTFKQALQKGMRSLENGRHGWGADGKDIDPDALSEDMLHQKLSRPNRERFLYLRYALQRGMGLEEIFALTGIDPWWLDQLREILEMEKVISEAGLAGMDDPKKRLWRRAKEYGFCDLQLAHLLGADEAAVRAARQKAGVRAVYKSVDGCAGAHRGERGYYWGAYGDEDESRAGATGRDAILILGGGPNRIGQGLEFDYCCCHAAYAVRDAGLDAVLVNCNPETVSTDFDTSDRLYFEPLTVEDVLAIVDREKPRGVIVQFGGQTPLNISRALMEAGVPILGTCVDSIDRASDRGQFSELLRKLGLRQPPNATATTLEDAVAAAESVGYPLLCRPSFVLGGAKMEIVSDAAALKQYWRELLVYCTKADVVINERRPILLDKFLDDAIEVDVDAISDGKDVYIAGVMEHIEEAGVHSGDSACSLPPHSLPADIVADLENATRRLAVELGVRGLMNVQYAIQGETVYVLEVNPRASRTVPFVSKVTGAPVARLATRVMLGSTIAELGLPASAPTPAFFGVKEAVFPFSRFPGADAVLGPEMKSTGEVMGLDPCFPLAFAKSQLGAGQKMPLAGTAFLSIRGDQHGKVPEIAQQLHECGFKLVATSGTARAIRQRQIPVELISKISAGRPNVLDLMADNRLHLVVNVPSGKSPTRDEISIRTTAVLRGVPLVTTIAGARAFVEAVRRMKQEGAMEVHALQDAMPVWKE